MNLYDTYRSIISIFNSLSVSNFNIDELHFENKKFLFDFQTIKEFVERN
jgi:hypothetical protein